MSLKNSKIRVLLVRFISNNRHSIIFQKVYKYCVYFVKAYNNVSYNSLQNGEMFVFKEAVKDGVETFIDCGANVGIDVNEYKKINPRLRVWALEIVEPIYKKLLNRTKGLQKVSCYNIGLGSEIGSVKIKYYPEANYLSSVYDKQEINKDYEILTANITTGDLFCDENGIEQLDYLKIDVEGMDFEVIKGFDKMISNDKIDIIQFEYTNHFIYAGSFLKDVYKYFEGTNYIIGKIYPTSVDFESYNDEKENFYDSNYIIINKRRKKLINRLSSKK